MIKSGEYYLVTTNEFFIGPDGQQYKAAWGKCKIENVEDVFGFKPIRPSTNWYLVIGEGEKSIIVAGCQIHYAIKTTERPKKLESYFTRERDFNEDGSPFKFTGNHIYFTE